MKIIALMPIKNEEWILKTTIPQLKLFADEILCLDGGSNDGTVELLKSYGVLVKNQDMKVTNYSFWRQKLLEWGRERGGTHFVWLDADEAFTTNFLPSFKEEISKLKPGEKLTMKWLCLWKSPYVYRNDSSVWSNIYKDFIVCDDGISSFGETALHEGRTPGITSEQTCKRLPVEKGTVLHFQFVSFKRFQTKQAFQRCRELILGTGSPQRINHKYSATLDDASALCENIPKEWLQGIEHLDNLTNIDAGWYYPAILELFKEKGVLFFEPLQIWHIPELHDIFIKEVKREPRIKTFPRILVILNTIKNKYFKK